MAVIDLTGDIDLTSTGTPYYQPTAPGAKHTLNGAGNTLIAGSVLPNNTGGNYASIFDSNQQIIINDLNIISKGGGVAVTDGANVTFNGGSVTVNTTNTAGRYNFYVVGNGSVLTINGGEFSFSETLNQKRAYIYAGDGTTVYVKGGTFGKASTRSGYTAGILGSGTVIITGGTFGFNPSAWVATGYQAVENDGVWTVSAI